MVVIDERKLRKVMLEDNLSCKEAAELFGCSHGTISNWAKKYGIDIKRRNWPTEEELRAMYIEERKSILEIAKERNIGVSTVKRLLQEYGLGIRKLGTNQYKSNSFEVVKKYFEENGCELISDDYQNANELLTYICNCGNKSRIRFSAFKRGQRCKKCGVRRGTSKQKLEYSFVKKTFEERGCKLLSKTYVNSNQKLEYICHCGNKATMRFNNFRKGYDCAECKRKRFLGANNHNYNPNLTDEERQELGRYEGRYKAFRKAVYKRDKYSCVVCGNGKSNTLVAHHLDSYSDFPDRRTDPENAVTLCESCHKDFHKQYGYKHNRKEQFEEYLSNK